MGLQTVGGKGLPPGGTVDKMAIFSFWNSTVAVPEPGVTEINFTGEGVGKSLRIAYNWQVGRTYQMVMAYNAALSNGSTSYWSASVKDKVSGIVTALGSIRLPSGLTTAQSGVAFHERYSGPVASCSDMSPSQVKFSNIKVDTLNAGNRATQSMNSWGIYQANIGACNSSFWAKDLPGAAFRAGVNTPAQ
jgi:hypothetical protein